MSAAIKHLQKDPVMAELVARFPLRDRTSYKTGPFVSLCRSIIGQQLSVKAAITIYKRFEEKTKLDPAKILEMTEVEGREIGLSRQKISYVSDLSRVSLEEADFFDVIDGMSNEEVTEHLTRIKGVGKWTAQMFLMFTLDRPDIFTADDLGLRRAIERHYGVKPDSKLDVYYQIAEVWSPFRTTASLYLWESLENEPNN